MVLPIIPGLDGIAPFPDADGVQTGCPRRAGEIGVRALMPGWMTPAAPSAGSGQVDACRGGRCLVQRRLRPAHRNQEFRGLPCQRYRPAGPSRPSSSPSRCPRRSVAAAGGPPGQGISPMAGTPMTTPRFTPMESSTSRAILNPRARHVLQWLRQADEVAWPSYTQSVALLAQISPPFGPILACFHPNLWPRLASFTHSLALIWTNVPPMVK